MPVLCVLESLLHALCVQERWYYLEAEQSGLQHWLKARTIGLPQAWNRLMSFQSVRSTRPVKWTPTNFIPNPIYSCRRDEFHLTRFPDYPEPERLLSYTQKYFFRHPALRHLRVEQFTRQPAPIETRSIFQCVQRC